MTRGEHRNQMENRIADFQASGQYLKKWCRDHDVSYYQMQYWLKKFRNEKASRSTSNWTSVKVDESGQRDDRACIHIKVGQATVEVGSSFDPSLLADVIRTLKTC